MSSTHHLNKPHRTHLNKQTIQQKQLHSLSNQQSQLLAIHYRFVRKNQLVIRAICPKPIVECKHARLIYEFSMHANGSTQKERKNKQIRNHSKPSGINPNGIVSIVTYAAHKL